jgi:hypothetical protein
MSQGGVLKPMVEAFKPECDRPGCLSKETSRETSSPTKIPARNTRHVTIETSGCSLFESYHATYGAVIKIDRLCDDLPVSTPFIQGGRKTVCEIIPFILAGRAVHQPILSPLTEKSRRFQ